MMSLETATEKIFNRCNLIGESCDVWAIMDSYKVVRDLPEKEYDELYDVIVKRLGFCW